MMKLEDKIFTIVLVLIAGRVLYMLTPILTPFLIGALLAYLADPLVVKLAKLRIPRLLRVCIVFFTLFLALILIIVLLIPLIQKQVVRMTDLIPKTVQWLQDTVIPWLVNHFGLDEEKINSDTLKTSLAQNWSKAGGAADIVFKTALHSGLTLLEWVTNLVLIPVVTFYLLCDWNKVVLGIRKLIPRRAEPVMVKLGLECDEVLSAFFRGQLLVMLALGIIYSIGLSLVGLQIGVMIGIIAGLLSVVPYLGFISGIVIASIAATVQFGGGSTIFFVWGVFAVGHLMEHFVLMPLLLGDRIGLHPVAVIFAILAGGCLFGFFGILVALPVAAVIMVLIRYAVKRYTNSHMYTSGS